MARFPGLYVPILDLSFDGPAPTDTRFDTVVVTRQYDGFADFPLYPLNAIADVNAVLGFLYVHLTTTSTSACPPIPRRRRPSRAPTVTPATTSSIPRICRCSVRCARWGCPRR